MNAASPFSRRSALGLVLGGAALFVALLWMVGAGLAHGPLADGGAHGAGTGLNGYAALSRLMDAQGWQVGQARSEAALKAPGLLVLTPPANADGADLQRIVTARRTIGPTLIVTPKWLAQPLDKLGVAVPGAKQGWVTLSGIQPPEWKGFLDDVVVEVSALPGARWTNGETTGPLPASGAVLSGRGASLVPLVETAAPEGRILAAFLADGGHYPALDAIALLGSDAGDPESGLFPLVVVFEPDLLDNQGLARSDAALAALRLITAAADGAPRTVTFDLSFNGFRRTPNLLTLAFTPPFLAATLCLIIAALIAGWRAFLRFGPPSAAAQPAFGKGPLVANAGGLVRRSGRLWLLGPPYAALVRERLARTLGLPRHADPAATEAAIDRIGHAADPASPPFSALAGRLRHARRRADLLRAAQDLHALERTLRK